MVVGCLEITLHLPEVHSLKEKRSIVRRALERTQNRFNVSAAEVGDNDMHQRAVLGFVTVANDHSFVNSVLDKVTQFVESDVLGHAQLTDRRLELIHF